MTATQAGVAAASRWRPYEAYRDSGAKWLGTIPAHWEIKPLKRIAATTFSNVDKKSEDGEIPVRLCNYVDVYYNDHITNALDFMEATAGTAEIARFELRAGDVLVTKDSESWDDIAVAAYVPERLPEVLCGYHLALIRPDVQVAEGRYLFRAIGARGVNDQFRVGASGITRYGLGKYEIENAEIPVPPLDEQRAISAFLDRETAKVDELIERKQQLIELLLEHRSALIRRAVTKGLDPSAPLRDSGVEWLGDVPAHWETRRLRDTVGSMLNGAWGEEPGSDGGAEELPCVRAADFDRVHFRVSFERAPLRSFSARDLNRRILKKGDLLLEKSGGGEQQPVGAVVLFDSEERAVHSNFIARIRVTDDWSPPFVTYLHAALYAARVNVRSIKQTTGLQNLDAARYLAESFAAPPLSEQVEIAEYLDRETARIDALVEEIEAVVERLREYRTAVISAAVTGKIDVRGEASAA